MLTLDSIRLLIPLSIVVLILGCSRQDEQDRVEYTLANGKKVSDVKEIQNGVAAYRGIGGPRIPAEAEQLHRDARVKGESGDYGSALTLLAQASEIAPDWSYPRYDMAFTYLLQGDMTNALLKYREVDRLEPEGFFTVKTALWTLEREEKGIFPKGTYLAFVSLEWATPEKKREMIEKMTTNLPTFAPGWKERALIEEPTEQRLAFLEKALLLDPDPETYGICMLNKAALLNASGRAAEAEQMLQDLLRNETSTRGTKALANEVLQNLTR